MTRFFCSSLSLSFLFALFFSYFDFENWEFYWNEPCGRRWHKTETTLIVATTLRRRWMKRAYRDASRAEGTARRPGTAPQTVINSSCPSLLDLPSNRRNLSLTLPLLSLPPSTFLTAQNFCLLSHSLIFLFSLFRSS